MIGYGLALLSSKIDGLTGYEIVKYSGIKFMYCFIVGIFIGMANMVGNDLYLLIKKKVKKKWVIVWQKDYRLLLVDQH